MQLEQGDPGIPTHRTLAHVHERTLGTHSLPVCEIDFRVGGKARYVWKNADFEMGMTSEFKEIVEHQRIVHTEAYDDWPEGNTTVTARFSEADGQTTITVDIEYLSQEARDAAMQPGFKEGFQASYDTLDDLLPDWA